MMSNRSILQGCDFANLSLILVTSRSIAQMWQGSNEGRRGQMMERDGLTIVSKLPHEGRMGNQAVN